MHLKHIAVFLLVMTLPLLINGCGKGNKKDDALPISIEVTSNKTSAIVGDEINLTATLLYSDTNVEIISEKVTWKSSDIKIATISDKLVATCLSVGEVSLTASFENFTSNLPINCNPVPFIQNLKISLERNKINEKSTLLVPIVAILSNNEIAEDVKFIWKSEDESIATVTNEGVITGIKYGKTKISATIDTTDLIHPIDLEEGFIWPEIEVLPITEKVTLALKGYDPANPTTEDLTLDLDLGESINLVVLEHKTDGTIEEISHRVRNWEYIKSGIKKTSSRDIQISENSVLTARTVVDDSITVNVASYLGFPSENSAIVRIEYPLEAFVTHDSGSQILLGWKPKFDSIEYRLKKRIVGKENIEEILISDTSYIDTNFNIENEIEYAIAYRMPDDSFSDDLLNPEDLNWIKVKPSLNRWIKKNQFPVRAYASSVIIEDSIFVFGGEVTDSNGTVNSTNEVWEYSISSQNWTQRKSMSSPRQNAAICELNGYIFLFGGFNTNAPASEKIYSDITIYKASDDTWIDQLDNIVLTKPTLNTPITNASCSNNGNLFYLSGGLRILDDDSSVSNELIEFSIKLENNTIDISKINTYTLKTPRQRHQSIIHDELLYIIGGKDSSSEAITHVEKLDLATTPILTTTYFERMPTARYDFSIEILNNNIFVFGGKDINDTSITDVEFLNTSRESDAWNIGDTMPFENAGFISEYDTSNNALYLFGGVNTSSETPEANQVIYNANKLSWHPLFNSDKNLYNSASGQIDNKFYLIGGQDITKEGKATNKTQQYNIDENSWVSDDFGPGALNVERNNAATVSIDGMIYILGGQDKNKQHLDSVEVLGLPNNPNNWQLSKKLNQPRSNACASEFNGLIYVFGGTNNNGFVENIEFFNPATQIWTSLSAKLVHPRGKVSCAKIRDTIYIVGGYENLSSKEASNIVEGFLPKVRSFKTSVGRLKLARLKPALTIFNDRIYSFGGSGLENTEENIKSEIYNPLANSWEVSKSLNLNSPSNITYSFIYKNKIFIFAEDQRIEFNNDIPNLLSKETTLYLRE